MKEFYRAINQFHCSGPCSSTFDNNEMLQIKFAHVYNQGVNFYCEKCFKDCNIETLIRLKNIESSINKIQSLHK
jgi:hypothetical protein